MTTARKHSSFSLSWTALAVIGYFLTSTCLCGVHTAVVKSNTNLDSLYLQQVMMAIEKAIDFFGQDYSEVNVDGLFGLRLAHGNILGTVDDCSSGQFHCPPELVSQLQEMNHRMDLIGNSALPYVEAQDPDYFSLFRETIDSPYVVTSTPERLGTFVPDKVLATNYGETEGDMCLSSLLGTYQYNGRPVARCTADDSCMQMMTAGHRGAYSITHQLLYFIIGDKAGCLKTLDAKLRQSNGTSTREFQKKLCQNIYSEAVEEATGGEAPLMKQDLFLEQSVLCGILGFQDFFSREWMAMVLQWQSSQGCFTMSGPLIGLVSGIVDAENEHRRLLKLLGEEARKIDEARPVMSGASRKLMREQVMEGDCLAHKTGLAIGTLGAYLRHLVHQVYGPA